MSTLVGLTALIGFVFLVTQPFFRTFHPEYMSSGDNGGRESLEARKLELVTSLRDLSLDFQMGKLDEKDFHELDGRYRAEAVDILRKLEQASNKKKLSRDSQAEALIAEYRQKMSKETRGATSQACATCGKALEHHYRFCPGCGSVVEAGAVSEGDMR